VRIESRTPGSVRGLRKPEPPTAGRRRMDIGGKSKRNRPSHEVRSRHVILHLARGSRALPGRRNEVKTELAYYSNAPLPLEGFVAWEFCRTQFRRKRLDCPIGKYPELVRIFPYAQWRDNEVPNQQLSMSYRISAFPHRISA